MKSWVLVAGLAIALPAFGAEEPKPAEKSATVEEVAPATAKEVVAEEVVAAVPARPSLTPDAVARGSFTTAIDQREPVDTITSIGNDQSRVYYFTELVGISGRHVTHRWEFQGEVMAEVPIAVGAPRWRAYSSKQLDPSQLGEWTVSVIDESGNVVREDSLAYEAAAPASEITSPAAAPSAQAAAEPSDEAPVAATPESEAPMPASPAPARP